MDAATSGGDSDPTAYTQHREALEMYAFLLLWFVQSAEKLARNSSKEGEPRAAARTTKVSDHRGSVQCYLLTVSSNRPEEARKQAKTPER
jgi:hypothetical protein